jgi:hypothetical protein
MRGKYEIAIEKFKRIYEETLDFPYVTQMVDDYYALSWEDWIIKWKAHFKA